MTSDFSQDFSIECQNFGASNGATEASWMPSLIPANEKVDALAKASKPLARYA